MTLDDLERIAREATQGGNGRPGRLTDSEIDRQHAGDHSFTAIESMACELRQRRAADKAIIALLAELRSARAVVEAAEEWRAAEIAEQEWAIGTDEYEQQSAVRARQRTNGAIHALRSAIDHHRTRKP